MGIASEIVSRAIQITGEGDGSHYASAQGARDRADVACLRKHCAARTPTLVTLFISPDACGTCEEAGKERQISQQPGQPPAPPVGVPPGDNLRGWGETDTSHLQRLGATDIVEALAGKAVVYDLDYRVGPATHEEYHEEYHEEGDWRGIRYMRGPRLLAGRWWIADDRLCATADSGLPGIGKHICREVWRDPRTGELLMEHVQGVGRGLMRLQRRSL